MADDNNLPVEEWKLCQTVIGQLENAIYRRQGWFFALITALIVARLKENPYLTKPQFGFLTIAIIVVFFVTEVVQRVPHHRAIQRAKKIEAHLRGETAYDGPILSRWLGKGESRWDFVEFVRKTRIWAPYVAILLVVAIVLLCTK
ncbi:hypothetical protein HED60_01405 [Planctomycetales bacterium ZRK34]|nr:hypothetical protein HED60_01405 [Planctomycetales bacterium ZRK34]